MLPEENERLTTDKMSFQETLQLNSKCCNFKYDISLIKKIS